jgi:putative flippase GtrA
LLVLAEHNGLRIHEVPVDWVDDPVSRVDIVRTAADDLRGVWRMVRRFALGDGELSDIGGTRGAAHARVPVDPRLGPQVVRFAWIGIVSTVVFAALFALLDGPLGPVGADVVALLVCAFANTAANRRLTFALRGRAGRARHYVAGTLLGLLPLGLTLAALAVLATLGVSSLAVTLITLTAANLLATVARFLLLRHWVFRP